jgi:hypothetical protein
MSSNSSSFVALERRNRPDILASDIDGAERVAMMLQHMIQIGVATEESYQIVLKALCDRGRQRWRRIDSKIVCAADEVGGLLDELWKNSPENISVETCNIALQAYAMCATPRGDRCYAQQAQELLDRMESNGLTIAVESLAHVLHAWAWQQANMQPEKCALMAENNLQRIKDLSPDKETLLQCYDWVLEARSKSGSDGSAQAADTLMQEMKEISSELGNKCFLPNSQSYSNAILAWSKCQEKGSARKAHHILLELLDCFKNGQLRDSEPELISFNGVITAWARIGRPDRAEEVLWMMDKMRADCKNLVPNVVSYNSVLHAHIRSDNKDSALERILAVVKYMEENAKEQPAIKCDSFTYNTLMKVSDPKQNGA